MAHFREWLKDKASIEEQGDHTMYWMPATVFNQLPINRWKHNRPPDEERVAEIREWNQTSKRVDGIIYLACVNNAIVCYESNHRREALRGILGLHNILVDMMWTATDEQVKQEFFRLNKAISVPELFVTTESVLDPTELLRTIGEFCSNYKSLQSPNKHPQRPNFNRDNLTEDVYQIVKETKLSIPEVMNRLELRNAHLRAMDKGRLSDKVIAKCEKTGLWLFAWSARLSARDL